MVTFHSSQSGGRTIKSINGEGWIKYMGEGEREGEGDREREKGGGRGGEGRGGEGRGGRERKEMGEGKGE